MKAPQKEKLREELRRLKYEFGVMVARFVQSNPELTYDEITALTGVHRCEISMYCQQHGVYRPRGSGSPAAKNITKDR